MWVKFLAKGKSGGVYCNIITISRIVCHKLHCLNAVLSCILTYSLTDSGHMMNYCISLRERGTRCSIGSRLNLGNIRNVEVHGFQFAPVDCSYNVGNLL